MQLDLFLDGREALLVNDVVSALLVQHPDAAADALDRLREESPAHPDLPGFDRLVRSLVENAPAPPDTGQLDPMLERLAIVVPAANRLLGPGAAAFMRPWWEALARVKAVPGPAEPAPVYRHWLGSALCHVGDERGAIRLWLPLCWLDPDSFARQAPTLPSALVRDAWSTFDVEADRDDEGDGRFQRVRWFPAWLALWHRWVAHLFAPDAIPGTDPPVRVLRMLPGLLVLESQGYSDELIRQRRALQVTSPSFFRIYRRVVVETTSRREP